MQPQDKADHSPGLKYDIDPGVDSDPDPEVEIITGFRSKIDQVKSWKTLQKLLLLCSTTFWL